MLGIFACSGNQKDEHGHDKETAIEADEHEHLPEDIVELDSAQIAVAGIELGKVQELSLSGALKVNGIITTASENNASVSAPLGGFVRSTSLLPGNAVSKGQTLAIIENTDFIDMQQNYLEAKNRLEFMQAEYNRHSELYKEDVYSQKNLQQTTADYKSLQTQVKALEQKLLLIGINPATLTNASISGKVALRSPISGYIKTVNANVGKAVSNTDVLFEIVNTDNLLLELTVFEKDMDKARVGSKIRFMVNNETEQHQAVVYQTGKSVGEDRSQKVYAKVIGKCPNTYPGMYVNAFIETTSAKAKAVPNEAVVNFEEKNYIFAFEKTKDEEGKTMTEYRMIPVQVGISDQGYTEVLPEKVDLKSLQIVIKGAYNLLSAKKNAGEMSC